MTAVLNRKTLDQLRSNPVSGLVLPEYDPAQVTASVLHFGPGNFSSGHFFTYLDDLIKLGHRDAGVVVVSPRLSTKFNEVTGLNKTQERIEALKAQDHLYSVWTNDGERDQVRVIGSVVDSICGPHEVQRVLDLIASPQMKMLTMTITQEGYYYDPTTNSLDFKAPPVVNSSYNNPQATVWYLVNGLKARKESGAGPIDIIPLDNFLNNGRRLMLTVLALAKDKFPGLELWIKANVKFYTTMVDRIVPDPTEDQRAVLSQKLGGLADSIGVLTEVPKKLVVQQISRKDPVTGKPITELPTLPLDLVGAKYVENVQPFEQAKIRLLNGLHMATGVLGRIMGFTNDCEALANPQMNAFAHGYLREVVSTLKPVPQLDYDVECSEVLQRMGNEFLIDPLLRLARNGSTKLERIIMPLRDAYARDLPRTHMVMALAAWVKYLAMANPDPKVGRDTEDGLFIEDLAAYGGKDKKSGIERPNLVAFAKQLNGDMTPIFSLNHLWGVLENNEDFIAEMQEAWEILSNDGQTNKLSLGLPAVTGPQ